MHNAFEEQCRCVTKVGRLERLASFLPNQVSRGRRKATTLQPLPRDSARRRISFESCRTAMSHKTVQSIVGRLITDEEYRLRFLGDPLGTLNDLRERGVELTRGEIEALVRTDRTVWIDAAERIDRQLQRSSLRSE